MTCGKESVPSEPCGKPPQSPAKETEGTALPRYSQESWEEGLLPTVQRSSSLLAVLNVVLHLFIRFFLLLVALYFR